MDLTTIPAAFHVGTDELPFVDLGDGSTLLRDEEWLQVIERE